ncbi:MAG: AraC family transcriptional regulator [Ramlibacter sp.]|nr:AraC family transcriptional regulator [Ramlibacter sp.]
MTAPRPVHRTLVLATPWDGVYGTHTASGRHFGRHSHGTYGMGLLEEGAHRSASGRGMVDAQAGDLLATNPGEVHDGRPLGGDSRRWRMVYLDPAVLQALAVEHADRAQAEVVIRHPVMSDGLLAHRMRALLDRVEGWNQPGGATPAESLACEEALVYATALLLERHAGVAPRRAGLAEVTRARERLADEMLAPPTLAALAADAGLSRFQLLRRFRQVHGLTPYAWLQQQRVEQARGLIRAGAGLAGAAAAAGFADQSHMTRLFVRQFGFTPGAWQMATTRARPVQ